MELSTDAASQVRMKQTSVIRFVTRDYREEYLGQNRMCAFYYKKRREFIQIICVVYYALVELKKVTKALLSPLFPTFTRRIELLDINCDTFLLG